MSLRRRLLALIALAAARQPAWRRSTDVLARHPQNRTRNVVGHRRRRQCLARCAAAAIAGPRSPTVSSSAIVSSFDGDRHLARAPISRRRQDHVLDRASARQPTPRRSGCIACCPAHRNTAELAAARRARQNRAASRPSQRSHRSLGRRETEARHRRRILHARAGNDLNHARPRAAAA